jgi:tetratricopeptide (TPR) repeat protein
MIASRPLVSRIATCKGGSVVSKVADAPKRARKPQREELPDTPNPLDIAMVAAVSGKPLPDIARRLLEEEARLIRAQCTELRLREIGERVRAALWAILAVAALAIVGLIVLVLVKASRSDELVVESFRVPPAMAAQGLTGDVVAKQVLDKIAEFQDKTESIRAATSYGNNWGDDLKIDIPQTGATADQIWKLLREWLGKETRISGEVIETKSGLALTARVGSNPGQRFVSTSGDLDALVAQGAEHIMSETQPYRYAIYLDRVNRYAEEVAMLQQLTANPSAQERKWAYNGLAVYLRRAGNFPGSIAAAAQALSIDPNMIPPTISKADANGFLGHNQAALDQFTHGLNLRNDGEYDPRILTANSCNELQSAGSLAADDLRLRESLACLTTAPASYRAYAPLVRSQIAFLRHDPKLVAPVVASSFVEPQEAAEDNAETRVNMLLVTQQSGAPLADALAAYQDAMAHPPSPALASFVRASEPVSAWPLEAEALARLGRTNEAAALISKTPLDCYDCLRARGIVAQAQGDLPGAQRWFLEAARQGPRLPQAFVDWGKLLLQARHYGSAEVKLRYAAKLAPNWADPLKYWGDALAGEGKRDRALAKYDSALKLTPKWHELGQARARAAAD